MAGSGTSQGSCVWYTTKPWTCRTQCSGTEREMELEVSSTPLPQSLGQADRSISSSVHHYTQPLTCFRASKVRGNWLWTGPEGHSTSKTSKRSAYCKERDGCWAVEQCHAGVVQPLG